MDLYTDLADEMHRSKPLIKHIAGKLEAEQVLNGRDIEKLVQECAG